MNTLALSTRIDTDLGYRLEEVMADNTVWMTKRRYALAGIAILASVLDLVLTQTILTIVADLTGHQPAEANPLMASFVMTWWAWPLRVGVPMLAVARDLRAGNYGLITCAAGLYVCVITWNVYMLWSLT